MAKENNTELEDLQLAKACLSGDDRAQTQLFETYSGQMMALCLRYANDYDEAQDLFQDGFVKVFRKLDLYNGKGPLGAWIRRTMANNALDHLRKAKRDQQHVLDFQKEFLQDEVHFDEDFDSDESETLSAAVIMELIKEMPMGYRTVFNMYAVEEYTHKEIADHLGITESTSKTQYRKAKAYMRKLIEIEQKKILSE
jgi:RNA polymerase sigma-70 factor (ECF subfamily)